LSRIVLAEESVCWLNSYIHVRVGEKRKKIIYCPSIENIYSALSEATEQKYKYFLKMLANSYTWLGDSQHSLTSFFKKFSLVEACLHSY